MTALTLSATGKRRLAKAEETIARGLSTFFEVGSALLSIKDERLYREDHATFEDYCQNRWGFSARRANQLMSAAEIGTIVPVANEGQARALAPLRDDPEAMREVMEEAQQSGPVTAQTLAKAVETRRPKNPTQGNGDDVTDGKGSPSGAPATAEPSAGEPVTEPIPDAPEVEESGVSASGAQPPAPSPPKDPALLHMADLSARRADVAKWLAFDRHEQVMDGMTAEQRADYRSFVHSVWTHASATIDYLDAPARLKAVQ